MTASETFYETIKGSLSICQFLVNRIMGTHIKKPHCFIGDDITVVTAENPVVSFPAAHPAVNMNNDKVFCNRHTVQAAKIISQWLSHERILIELIDFVANFLFNGRELLKRFNEIV
jgi:hypothetical protein